MYWHVARRVWYAQAKPAQGGYLGRFESETEAARALIRRGCAKSLYELQQRKVTVNEPPAEPSAKGKDFLTEERFGQLWAIYRAKSPDEPDRLPGDLEDAVSRAKWATSKAATPYVTFWCLLKYGPAREALEDVVRAAKGEDGGSASPCPQCHAGRLAAAKQETTAKETSVEVLDSELRAVRVAPQRAPSRG